MNKRGLAMMPIFFFTLATLLLLVFMGSAAIIYHQVDLALDQNVSVGQVNLRDINNDSFGKMADGFLNNADIISLAVIFSMIMMMLLNAYLFGDDNKLWIPIDIFFIVIFFIFSVYVSQVYEKFISSPGDIFSVYPDYLLKSSTLLLHLPETISILGALIMIVTYTKIGRDQREGIRVNEF